MKQFRSVSGFALVAVCFFGFACSGAQRASAQYQEQSQLNELFSQMKSGLDADLKTIIDDAIKNRQDFIELNADQLRRFRKHPLNPFEGLDKIDPDRIGGKIKLHFEVPTVRNRKLDQYERQHATQLQSFDPICTETSKSTVEVFDGQDPIALGSIVRADGLIISKYSEVRGKDKLNVRLPDGRQLPAELTNRDRENDIALLKINADNLTPIKWSNRQVLPGSFVVTVDASGRAIAVGSYSSVPRSLIGENQAVLGVNPIETAIGLQVERVSVNSAAMIAGLQVGDVITKINGDTLSTLNGLVTAIRQKKPGDKIQVEFIREGQRVETTAELGGRNVGGSDASRFKMMNRFGTIPSRRSSEFPLVFQHDTPLLPEQCGGPLVGLDGEVLGVNIARGGRVASYAIPANHMETIVANLIDSKNLYATSSGQ
jgi:S1-C subfamily serine protease